MIFFRLILVEKYSKKKWHWIWYSFDILGPLQVLVKTVTNYGPPGISNSICHFLTSYSLSPGIFQSWNNLLKKKTYQSNTKITSFLLVLSFLSLGPPLSNFWWKNVLQVLQRPRWHQRWCLVHWWRHRNGSSSWMLHWRRISGVSWTIMSKAS